MGNHIVPVRKNTKHDQNHCIYLTPSPYKKQNKKTCISTMKPPPPLLKSNK